MKGWKCAVLVLAATAQARWAEGCDSSTRTIVGDATVNLAYVLKYSPYSTTSETANTEIVTIASIDCATTDRGVFPDVMPNYFCDTPAAAGPLNAKLLWDALKSIGVFADGGMSKTHFAAQALSCTIDKNALATRRNPLATSPSCTVTAIWGDTCN